MAGRRLMWIISGNCIHEITIWPTEYVTWQFSWQLVIRSIKSRKSTDYLRAAFALQYFAGLECSNTLSEYRMTKRFIGMSSLKLVCVLSWYYKVSKSGKVKLIYTKWILLLLHFDMSVSSWWVSRQFLLLPCFFTEIPVLRANRADPNQTPRSVASDLGPHCLPRQLKWNDFYRIAEIMLPTLKHHFSFDPVQKQETNWTFTGCQMPNFMIVLMPYINFLTFLG